MRSTLRNFLLASAAMGIAALTTSTAMADTLVKVSFTFNVAGRNCPAGLYSLHRDLSSGLVTLSSMDRSRTFSWLAGPGEPGPADNRVVLRFDHLGETHTLQSVQYQTIITSRQSARAQQAGYVAWI
jgi:hypothetical protein